MKTTLGVMLMAVSVLSGCSASTGVDRAAAASKSIDEFQENVKVAQKHVDLVITAMNGLTTATELKPAYEKFVSELSRAESYATSIKGDAEEMKAKGREYFKKWEEELGQIKNEELREKAKARASERSKEYSNIELVMATAKGKWTPLSSELNDVKQYLANDLTPKGVASLSGTLTKANVDATDLKKALSEVIATMEKVQADFGKTKAAGK
jgi:hypothetical protein